MLMKFIQIEGKFPLESANWKDSYRFPRRLLKVSELWNCKCILCHSEMGHALTLVSIQLVIDGLLQEEKDSSALIFRYQEYLEYDDVRYYTMSVTHERIAQVYQNTKKVNWS